MELCKKNVVASRSQIQSLKGQTCGPQECRLPAATFQHPRGVARNTWCRHLPHPSTCPDSHLYAVCHAPRTATQLFFVRSKSRFSLLRRESLAKGLLAIHPVLSCTSRCIEVEFRIAYGKKTDCLGSVSQIDFTQEKIFFFTRYPPRPLGMLPLLAVAATATGTPPRPKIAAVLRASIDSGMKIEMSKK